MTASHPLIGAAIIVKNEAEHLRRCLGSLEGFCDELVVVDTGSTDQTVEIAESFGARVLHKPWRNDFAASRNFALDAVTATWVLYVDADEELRMVDRSAIREKISTADDVMAFGLRMHTQVNWTPYLDFRLWRHHPEIRFSGEIHESSMSDVLRIARDSNQRLAPIDIDIQHHGYEGDLTNKHLRNLPLLLNELKVHPEKINLWNHLGRVYFGLGRPDLAESAWRTGIDKLERQGPMSQFDVQIYASLVDLYLQQGRPADSLLGRAISIDPHFQTFRWLRARLLASTGRFYAAIEEADHLIGLGHSGVPDHGVAYNLDMFGPWPTALKADCLFSMRSFEDFRQLCSTFDDQHPNLGNVRRQLEVIDAHDEWRRHRTHPPIDNARVRLDGVTVIVTATIDGSDDLTGLQRTIAHLNSKFDCRLIVGTDQPAALSKIVSEHVEVLAVESSSDFASHETRTLNHLARTVTTPIQVHLATGFVVPTDQLLTAIQRVASGQEDLVIPHTFALRVHPNDQSVLFETDLDLDRIPSAVPLIGESVRGCRVWSSATFNQIGMENERLVDPTDSNSERTIRLSKLGGRWGRVAGPAFMLRTSGTHATANAQEYRAVSALEGARIARIDPAELEREVKQWPWVDRGAVRTDPPIEASDLTVLIPVRIDTSDRLRNLDTCIRALNTSLDCRVVVGVGDRHSLGSISSGQLEIIEIHDPTTQPFHRTRIINDMVRSSGGSIIAVIDTDVVIPREQWRLALEALRGDEVDMVYPYDGRMVEVPYGVHAWLERGEIDHITPDAPRLIEASSVGGCFLMNRDSFLAYGMENEAFVSWGYEDNERILRAHKLGLRVRRTTGASYHVQHRRGPDSGPSNPFTESNARELQRLKSLTDTELRAEVADWPWLNRHDRVTVLLWNDSWHEDGQLVDPSDRQVRVVRDRELVNDCDLVVVSLPTLDVLDLPPPGRARRLLLTREAEAHVPGGFDPAITNKFDGIVSHRRSSDSWAPYIPDEIFEPLPDIVTTANRHPVLASAWISSKWDASGRSRLLSELMLHLQVDSYGRLLRNTGGARIESHSARRTMMANYRFAIAFENARETDYVTEKFYDPLIIGSVPIYLGAPNVAEFAPGEHCYIDASEFGSARDLADFLLSMSDEEYTRYHDWRRDPLRTEFLRMCESRPAHILSPLISEIRSAS